MTLSKKSCSKAACRVPGPEGCVLCYPGCRLKLCVVCLGACRHGPQRCALCMVTMSAMRPTTSSPSPATTSQVGCSGSACSNKAEAATTINSMTIGSGIFSTVVVFPPAAQLCCCSSLESSTTSATLTSLLLLRCAAGDGARRDKDGYIWITGRVDDVINVSGHR